MGNRGTACPEELDTFLVRRPPLPPQEINSSRYTFFKMSHYRIFGLVDLLLRLWLQSWPPYSSTESGASWAGLSPHTFSRFRSRRRSGLSFGARYAGKINCISTGWLLARGITRQQGRFKFPTIPASQSCFQCSWICKSEWQGWKLA